MRWSKNFVFWMFCLIMIVLVAKWAFGYTPDSFGNINSTLGHGTYTADVFGNINSTLDDDLAGGEEVSLPSCTDGFNVSYGVGITSFRVVPDEGNSSLVAPDNQTSSTGVFNISRGQYTSGCSQINVTLALNETFANYTFCGGNSSNSSQCGFFNSTTKKVVATSVPHNSTTYNVWVWVNYSWPLTGINPGFVFDDVVT